MCQLLGHHPHIYSIVHSSPLSQLIDNLRQSLSDNPFLLAQTDTDFDLTYNRLIYAFRGLINGWFAETDKPVVVDKNRGWLRMIETVNLLDPNFRMIVCLRDLRQIFGSIEAQHKKTLLLDFPDHIAPHSAFARADIMFGTEGVIGGPLKSIESLHDVDDALRQRLCYVTFEALVNHPVETMRTIHQWMGLPPAPLDPENLSVKPHESDSYYRFKFRHHTHSKINAPKSYEIPKRIEEEILKKFEWFYNQFYPGLIVGKEKS
jgi:sulfotransferase